MIQNKTTGNHYFTQNRFIRISGILLCVLLLSIRGAHAQEYGHYQLKISLEPIRNSGNSMCKTHFKISTHSQQNSERVLFDWYPGGLSGGRYTPKPDDVSAQFDIQNGETPGKVVFYSERGWEEWFSCKFRSDSKTEYGLDLRKTHLDEVFTTAGGSNYIFRSYETTAHLKFHPVRININYFEHEGEGEKKVGEYLLPDKDVITLKATKGFIEDTYDWEYSIDGINWINFPAAAKYKDKRTEVTFKGTDLYSEQEFKSLIGNRTIRVRVNAVTEEQHYGIVLIPTYSAPHFLSHEIEKERCNNSQDAFVRFTFDRALETDEVMVIKGNYGIIHEQDGGNIELDGSNSCTVTELETNTHNFSLWNTYKTKPMYTGHPDHKRTVVITERPRVNHSAVKKDVSCFGGSDGKITITADGGTYNYIATLWDVSTSKQLDERTFTSVAPMTFGGLSAGNYEVRITDTNGCVMRKTDGTELTYFFTLSQPSDAVSVTLEQLTAPLAYNSSDGFVTVRVSGGTPSAGGYNITWINEKGKLFASSSSSKDGADYLYTLKGIPAGQYTVTAEDSRYAFLEEEDKQTPCGCSFRFPVEVVAPPKIEVGVEETHFINCHGSDEGQLTAHAKGGVPHGAGFPYTYTWYKVSASNATEIKQPNDSIIRNLTVGKYKVKITDANGIEMYSPIHDLIQPDSLQIAFEKETPACNDGVGRIKAIVSGGTPPYRYEWNKDGETTAEITSLTVGWYMVRVTDERGCTLTQTIEVTSPAGMEVDTVLVHPTCFNGMDGSIELKIKGATPPYKVEWQDNKEAGVKRTNLSAGAYLVRITDSGGCNSTYSFILNEPEQLSLSLEPAFTLCKGHTREVTAVSSHADVVYNWTHNGSPLTESTAKLTVGKAGTYRATVTNPAGCTASAEVVVSESNVDFPLDVTIPASAAAGADIHAVNISRVKADRLEWKLPAEAQVVSKGDEEAVFTIQTPGIYTIMVVGYKDDCSTVVTQNLEVLSSDEIILPGGDGTPLIKQFLVTPNPTEKEFKVLIELKEPADFTLLLYSPTGALMDKKIVSQTEHRIFEYELRGDIGGVFELHLLTRSDKAIQKITKKGK